MTAEIEPKPLLELDGVTKAFPGVVACDDITFDVGAGEIHALLGENGAGKSTLVKLIYGMMRPDRGAMRFDGASHSPARPADARARGIGMIFQHFSLFEALTVTDNIALGLSPADARDRSTGDLAARIVEVARGYGLDLEPERQVGRLSVGERQRVEIVRCLLANPRLIIMDEPTSVLSPIEVETLFATLRTLRGEGRSILYISHKLEEIRQLCDRATVLRGGRKVATCNPREETAKSLAEMMLGDKLSAPRRSRSADAGAAGDRPADRGLKSRQRLVIDRLTVRSADPFGVSLADVSLSVSAGEIVGIAGVAGNGQGELMAALIGETSGLPATCIVVDDLPIGHLGPSRRRKAGLTTVPEQRLGHGAVPDMMLSDNAILPTVGSSSRRRGGFIDRAGAHRLATTIIGAFGVRARGTGSTARTLSGGNLQKFIIGRELLQSPAVFVAAQPTWGVDAGAAAFIHKQVLELAATGTAVVLVSQDLDELLALSDRIAILAGGRLTAAEPVASLSLETIGRRMGGAGSASAVAGSGAVVVAREQADA